MPANLRNHVHVLGEFAQESGQGGWLFEDDELLHLLRRLRWKKDATSPGGKKEENDYMYGPHNSLSIHVCIHVCMYAYMYIKGEVRFNNILILVVCIPISALNYQSFQPI